VNPVGLFGKYYAWNDSNGDLIPQQNEWLPQGAKTDPVNAFGGSSTHINSNMSRPYSDQLSAGYEKTDLARSARWSNLLLPHEEEFVWPGKYRSAAI